MLRPCLAVCCSPAPPRRFAAAPPLLNPQMIMTAIAR